MISSENRLQWMTTRLVWMGLLLVLLLMAACTSPTTPPATSVPSATLTPSPSSTPTPSGTLQAYLSTIPARQTQYAIATAVEQYPWMLETPLPTPIFTTEPCSRANCSTQTYTPTPTAGIEMRLPTVTPLYIGTPFPAAEVPINAENYPRLANVAQWGRGSIHVVTYTPDGRSIVVGSSFGIAIYATDDLTSPPRWVPFDPPNEYDLLFFSRDGIYLLLISYWSGGTAQIRNFANGEITNPSSVTYEEWVIPTVDQRSGYRPGRISPDGTLAFNYFYRSPEGTETFEVPDRGIYNLHTNTLFSTLTDELPYLYYEDYHLPEGCDVPSTNPGGSESSPRAMEDYHMAFSSTNNTITVEYRPHELTYTHRFSFLRVYNTLDGSLITQIGSFANPVQDFAYSPDGNTLLVGYVNGSFQLWDIPHNRETFTAWHFNAPIDYLAYSYDVRYLLVQRMGMLEVRQSSDGSLINRLAALSLAVDPVGNLVAIADEQGNISLTDIPGGQVSLRVHAHNGPIYALAFSPDGQTLVSSGEDCAVRLWDVATGASLHTFEETRVDPTGSGLAESRIFIYQMRFVPGTNLLLGYGSWGTAVGWEVDTGDRQYVINTAMEEYNLGVINLEPQYPELFNLDVADNLFYINGHGYNLESGASLGPYPFSENVRFGCSLDGPRTADGKLLFTIGDENLAGRVCILDAQDYSYLGSIRVVPADPNTDLFVSWPYLTPDGQQLVVTTKSGVIFVYQVIP